MATAAAAMAATSVLSGNSLGSGAMREAQRTVDAPVTATTNAKRVAVVIARW